MAAGIRLSDYDYDLPKDRIAQHPAERRDESRLLVLDRRTGKVAHRRFREIAEYLRRDDVLVLNDTKVMKSRLMGVRATGGRVEALLLREKSEGVWEALFRPGGRLRMGERIQFEDGAIRGEMIEPCGEGIWVARFRAEGKFRDALESVGRVPLPPYIARKDPDATASAADAERYQTVYARQPGAVAAPTAGLHFTKELLEEIGGRGVGIAYVTLHVGLGTFKPITVEDVTRHRMHSEWFEIAAGAAAQIAEARRAGGRIVAVGTTSCRVLETAGKKGTGTFCRNGPEGASHKMYLSPFSPQRGETDIFICPPYRFLCTDVLLTNFHLPRTTLLLLVCAFAGREAVLGAYEEAIKERYRFYSYGDAMLIL